MTDASPSQLPFELGVVFDRAYPAATIVEYARRAEAVGLDSLWVIEDCFFTTGVTLAATALTATERLRVGLGIMPARARTAAFTAMEIATLANIGGGRFTPGIGHGVQAWMAQMGVAPASPLTALDETITNVKKLLAGDEVTFAGDYVTLDRVRLEQPPTPAPPVLAGVQQQRSLRLAGQVADGVILVEGVGANYIEWALAQAQRHAPEFQVVTFTICCVADDRPTAYRAIAPLIAGLVTEETVAMRQLACFEELQHRVATGGPDALVDLAPEHWSELGAIGTVDDALVHLRQLAAAGASTINLYPGPDLEDGWATIDIAATLRAALGAADTSHELRPAAIHGPDPHR